MYLLDLSEWLRAADKLEACEGQLSHSGRLGRFVSSGSKKDASGDQQLHKICCDANKLALEHIKGMSGQVLTSASLAYSHALYFQRKPSQCFLRAACPLQEAHLVYQPAEIILQLSLHVHIYCAGPTNHLCA